GGGPDRDCPPVDERPLPHFDTDMDRLVETGLEEAARRAAFLRIPERGPELPDDLVLANDHRIDAGRESEQVAEGTAAIMDEEVLSPEAKKEITQSFPAAFHDHFHTVAGLEQDDTAEAFTCSGKELRFVRKPEPFEGHHVGRVMA